MNYDVLIGNVWKLFLESHPGTGSYQFELLVPSIPPNICSLNADAQVFCASTFKGYVLAQCVRMMEAKLLRLDDKLTITDDNKSPGGHYWNYVPGTQVSVGQALNEMIHHSDNTATDMLLAKVTPKAVRDLLAQHSIGGVIIPNSTRAFVIECFGLGPDRGADTTREIAACIDHGTVKNSPYGDKVTQRMVSPAASLSRFYGSTAYPTAGWFETPEGWDLFQHVLATTPAGMMLMVGTPHADVVFFKGGSLDLQPYNVAAGAGRMVLRKPGKPDWYVNFACIFNGSTRCDHPELLTDFQGTLGTMLRIYADSY
jgi:hypothetical protein